MSTEAQKLGRRLTKLADSLDKSLSDGAYVTPGFDVYLVKRLLREAAVALASSQDRLSEAEQALQALREEVEGLRADSERYKWLRNSSAHQWTHPVVVSQERTEHGMRYLGPMTGKTLDSAIDAAIRNGGEGVDE
jgi:hypothetical protein